MKRKYYLKEFRKKNSSHQRRWWVGPFNGTSPLKIRNVLECSNHCSNNSRISKNIQHNLHRSAITNNAQDIYYYYHYYYFKYFFENSDKNLNISIFFSFRLNSNRDTTTLLSNYPNFNFNLVNCLK